MSDVLEQRKKTILSLISAKTTWLFSTIVFIIAIISYKIRTSNVGGLIDTTTGKHIPLALDPFVFLRYAKELLTTGSLAAIDTLRYVPHGYEQIGEFSLLTHYVVYLYKFLNIFNSSLTLEYVHVIYPALTFSLTLIFFFLLVKKLFEPRVALLATAYLASIPILLYRTMGGFSDKESLALFLFVLTFYFYVSAWLNPSRSKSVLFGLLAGLVTGLMGLTWGGVQFAFLILGLFALIEIVLGKFTDNDLYTYASWSLIAFIVIFTFSGRYNLNSFMSPTFGTAYFVLFMGLLNHFIKNHNFLHLKTKFQTKIPLGALSLCITTILAFLFIITTKGFSFIKNTINDQLSVLINPFAVSRWGVTVAESHQPYFRDIVGQLGQFYIFLFILGSIFLFYNMVKNIKKHKFKLTIFYTLFILAFLFSRYSPESILNGANALSLTLYMGSLIIFVVGLLAFYIYSYRKDKETYQNILNINKTYTLVFIWFLIKIIAARSVVRLVLLLAFITVILVAYFFITLLDYSLKHKNKFVKYGGIIVILVLMFSPSIHGSLTNYTTATINSAKQVGPSYGPQWQHAMKWVRESSPKDAVFAHWWDYGYWVQTGGERATISDGGNVGGPGVNYFTARNLLTSPSETDALAFMKAKNATHFLTLSDDIGKYPAYSSIGSDLENDRYSWINHFNLNPSRTQETRDSTLFIYEGASILDEDFIYEDKLFPERAAGIAGFIVPLKQEEDGGAIFLQPKAVLIHNNQQYSVPVSCIVFDKKQILFDIKGEGLDACLLFIPKIDGNEGDPKGSILYLSKKVKDSLFAKLYLYGIETEHFKIAYTDETQIPLGIYNGRLFGPLKIWEVNIPENIEVDPKLYELGLPDPELYYIVP
tara:strand:- start:1101 stop:3725 length:2625 start_codon:yes stop_codon:yes gene_type:complete